MGFFSCGRSVEGNGLPRLIRPHPLIFLTLSLSEPFTGLRMSVLTQCIELFPRDLVFQSQPFSIDTNPLTGTNLSGGVVIVPRQVLDKVPFCARQLFMGDSREHSG